MKSILVTGATGFLGGALIKKLGADPDRVVLLVRDRSDTAEPFLYSTNVVFGDLTNFDLVRRTIADYEIDTVYHMASQAIVRVCAQDPLSAYQTNVMGTVNLLEAIRQVGMPHIKSVVVSTSDKVYGHAKAPYNEETPFLPKYTYEATKACQDFVAQNYFHNYGLPVKIVRCSNVYGPGDPNRSRLIPTTITRVLNGESPRIYEDVMNYVREFVYIDDTVSAFRLVAEKGVPGEAYCAGGVPSYTVGSIVQEILRICNRQDLGVQLLAKTANFKEIEDQSIDGSKIRALGWSPEVDLEDGLIRTIAYYKRGF